MRFLLFPPLVQTQQHLLLQHTYHSSGTDSTWPLCRGKRGTLRVYVEGDFQSDERVRGGKSKLRWRDSATRLHTDRIKRVAKLVYFCFQCTWRLLRKLAKFCWPAMRLTSSRLKNMLCFSKKTVQTTWIFHTITTHCSIREPK